MTKKGLRRPAPHLWALTLGLVPFLTQPLFARGGSLLGPEIWSHVGFLVSVLRAPGRLLLGLFPIDTPAAAGVQGAGLDPWMQGALIALVLGANVLAWWLTIAVSVTLGERLRFPPAQGATGSKPGTPEGLSETSRKTQSG